MIHSEIAWLYVILAIKKVYLHKYCTQTGAAADASKSFQVFSSELTISNYHI
jgi:hypothetical protein